MNWGYKIFFAYTIFIGIMMYLVIRSFQTNVDLVTEDYYGEEIRFQEMIDKQKNTATLDEKIKAKQSDSGLVIFYPKELQSLTGELTLYRPSAAVQDKTFTIDPDSEYRQVLENKDFITGKYLLKFDWTDGNKQYYQEIPIFYQ